MWKLIPQTIFCINRSTGKAYPKAPVVSIKLHPPTSGATHEGTAIRGACHLAEIVTPYGTRHFGFADGYINSSLRMAVKLWPGCERDEIVRRWEDTSDERKE